MNTLFRNEQYAPLAWFLELGQMQTQIGDARLHWDCDPKRKIKMAAWAGRERVVRYEACGSNEDHIH